MASCRPTFRFDTRDRADWLPPKRLGAWLSSVGYCGRVDPTVLHAPLPRCTARRPRRARHHASPHHPRAADRAQHPGRTDQGPLPPDQRTAGPARRQARVHQPAPLWQGPRRPPAHRDRGRPGQIPTPESLACLAGAAPSTRQSGKLRAVGFRWACDKQPRDAVTEFAADSRRANPWAADLYNRARARGHDHPHAVRMLARAWLLVVWRCWRDHAADNPDRHGALQHLIQEQQAVADTGLLMCACARGCR